ncbi:hypothetical protein DVT68_10615 [Dyella solisilvae]|uniref:Uncharacterized protein n=1 Tax=Dyella solisilvae TaxID=1920168 RepID=A0A370K8H6_9GAMM|nr:HEPN domain-containing protein [Dyella solisilvae]RDI98939.1 hypothetical protein DVT68_10615 [Dyella solisilvae]
MPTKDFEAASLKTKHRQVRDGQPEDLRVRIHRAISWLDRAEREVQDMDARFIFLWVSLNAAYAREFGFEQTEREQTRAFVSKVLSCDHAGRLQEAVFKQFTGPIRTLVENKFVFEPFWRAMREHDSGDRWEVQFASSKRIALRALMDRQTDVVLSIILDRLYVLRNQLVHGGATWNSGANRAQVKDGAAILATLMPIIIDVMMDGDSVDFEPIAFPHIKE